MNLYKINREVIKLDENKIKVGDWVYTFDNATDYLIGSVIDIKGKQVFGTWAHSISLPKDYYDLSLLQFKTMYDVSINKNELHKLNLNNNIKQIKNDEGVIQLENGNYLMHIIEEGKTIRSKMHLFPIGVDWDKEYNEKYVEEEIEDTRVLVELSLDIHNKEMFDEYTSKYKKLISDK